MQALKDKTGHKASNENGILLQFFEDPAIQYELSGRKIELYWPPKQANWYLNSTW